MGEVFMDSNITKYSSKENRRLDLTFGICIDVHSRAE